MAKTYINTELQIVRMNNNDIVTTSAQIGNPITNNPGVIGNAPDRRRSIWD